MRLDTLPRGANATILSIDWDRLDPAEGKRLRALGFDQGAEIGIAHRGVFGGADPLAITIGRMTVAVRRHHAAAMEVAQA